MEEEKSEREKFEQEEGAQKKNMMEQFEGLITKRIQEALKNEEEKRKNEEEKRKKEEEKRKVEEEETKKNKLKADIEESMIAKILAIETALKNEMKSRGSAIENQQNALK